LAYPDLPSWVAIVDGLDIAKFAPPDDALIDELLEHLAASPSINSEFPGERRCRLAAGELV
jgi:hypothetical protein